MKVLLWIVLILLSFSVGSIALLFGLMEGAGIIAYLIAAGFYFLMFKYFIKLIKIISDKQAEKRKASEPAPKSPEELAKHKRAVDKIVQQVKEERFTGMDDVEDELEAEDYFHDQDQHGLKRLKILTNVKLTGVTREFEGVNPQVILELIQDEMDTEIKLVRKQIKGHPHATAVYTIDDEPLGWVPESFSYLEDIASRLDDGATVLANINNIYGGDDGKSYGITINIARYENLRRTLDTETASEN